MIKIATMDGVREYAEGFPVELLWDEERKRYIIYAQNQGGYDCVQIDFADLISFLQKGPWTTATEDGSVLLHGRNVGRDPSDIPGGLPLRCDRGGLGDS